MPKLYVFHYVNVRFCFVLSTAVALYIILYLYCCPILRCQFCVLCSRFHEREKVHLNRSKVDRFPIHSRGYPRLLSLHHPNHTLTSPLPFTPFVHIFCRDPFDPFDLFDLFDPFVHIFAMTLLTLLTPIFTVALWHSLLFRQTCSAILMLQIKGQLIGHTSLVIQILN